MPSAHSSHLDQSDGRAEQDDRASNEEDILQDTYRRVNSARQRSCIPTIGPHKDAERLTRKSEDERTGASDEENDADVEAERDAAIQDERDEADAREDLFERRVTLEDGHEEHVEDGADLHLASQPAVETQEEETKALTGA